MVATGVLSQIRREVTRKVGFVLQKLAKETKTPLCRSRKNLRYLRLRPGSPTGWKRFLLFNLLRLWVASVLSVFTEDDSESFREQAKENKDSVLLKPEDPSFSSLPSV